MGATQRSALMPWVGALFATIALGVQCSAQAADRSRSDKPDAVVRAKVLVMQGTCNIVGCPDMLYQVDVFEAYDRSRIPGVSDAELTAALICAPWSLAPGSVHRLEYFKTDATYQSMTNMPRLFSTEPAQCDFAARVAD